MNDDTTAPAIQHPARSRLQSVTLQADVIRVAIAVAETRERLAETLRRRAGRDPQEAARLSATITAAENHAARARRMASALRARREHSDDIPA